MCDILITANTNVITIIGKVFTLTPKKNIKNADIPASIIVKTYNIFI